LKKKDRITKPNRAKKEKQIRNREEEKESRSIKERKIKTDYCLCVFFIVAGGGDPHRQRRETEERKTFPIHRLCHL
jgi:hypothetical protein